MSKNKSKVKYFILGITGFIVVVGTMYLNWFLPHYFYNNIQDYGSFGDQFGIASAIFSGLAFTLFIITLIMQKEELKLQREELEATRLVMKQQNIEFEKQTKQFEIQNRNIELQKIESTYYNLLDQYLNKIGKLIFNNGLPYDGYEALFHANDSLENRINEGMGIYPGKSIQTQIKNLFYEGALSKRHFNRIEFEQILKGFRVIFKFLENITIPEIEYRKSEYYDIFITSISNYELIFLFIFGMMDENKDLKDVIEKYGLFRDFNNQLLTFYQEHPLLKINGAREFYNKSAYESNLKKY